MSCTKSVRFELRRNTSTAWTASTMILLAGEPGVETDTGQMKIGNGTDLWSALPYVGTVNTPSNNTSISGDPFDYALVRNIGMHAYINNADVSYDYNIITNALTYTIVLYGNAIYCDVLFTYTPSLSMSSYTYSSADTLNYNNSATSGQSRHTITAPFTVTNPVSGNYVVTIDINTANTGGIGNGSYITKTLPFTITATDAMGYPDIVSYPLLNIVAENDITVSGITYYGPGSYIPVSAKNIQFRNIYNIYDNRYFNAAVFSTNSQSYNYAVLSAASLLYLNGGVYTSFPAASAVNANYFNGSDFNMVIASTNGIACLLTNAINKQTFKGQFFPSVQTGQGSQTGIGYLSSNPNETNIPLNQGGSTISGVSSMTRRSIANSVSNADQPDAGSIQVASDTALTNWDPVYYPYDGYYHATNSFVSGLNSTYMLPSTAVFSNPGTKYLLIKIVNTAPLKLFTLRLGSSVSGVTNVWVYWSGTTGNYGWYDASADWTTSTGCQNGYSGTQSTWQIKINQTVFNSYDGGGYIYLNIKFTGQIRLSDILLQ